MIGSPTIDHGNAGLLDLQRQMEQGGLGLLDDAARAEDLLATDAIAIAFLQGLPKQEQAVVVARVQAVLGPDWMLCEDSIQSESVQYRGLTAYPPPGKPVAVGTAWSLSRQLAAVEGVASAAPLIAQVAPGSISGAEAGLAAEDEDGPVDPAIKRTWHLEALRVAEAWELLKQKGKKPGEGVTVGVVDTGYTDHPQIFDRFTRVKGHPDTVRGEDLIDGADPRDPLAGVFPLTTPSHGTAVASYIASPWEAPGEESVNGIAPAAQILPVRVTTNVALLLPNKVTPGILRAVDAGADVINVSLGLPYYWEAFHAAVRYAVGQGVIIVAASGNYWPGVVYPARFPEVLAAANCNWKRHAWRWAGAGETVDVYAPGVDVWRAFSRNDNGVISFGAGPSTGTTFASASCTSLAALWLSFHGGRAKLIRYYKGDKRRVPQAFHYLMRTSAEPQPSVIASLYGEGLVQADKLLRAKLPAIEELDRDDQAIRLALTPLAGTEGVGSFGLTLKEAEQEVLLPRLREMLGPQATPALFEELLGELAFHLSSRQAFRSALLQGDLTQARLLLLGTEHLSPGLRRQLEAAPAEEKVEAELLKDYRPPEIPRPPYRALQVYAFDPGLSTSLKTMDYNRVMVEVPWEKLEPGPVGEYLEVVDVDPASAAAYAPVDLDDPALLASDGLQPDESRPWFHQQMVYAVAMKTIKHFETALGRPAMWAAGRFRDGKEREPFYRQLRIYPHALRERNAYYSPEKRALLFGYFRSPGRGGAPTGPMVFTCLSYDIIAHETTHALLDGMYHYYVEDTNADMLAFHEAFADIVALFQHFTHPEVLRATIRETRGDLETESLLGQLARQFGQAIGSRGALRDAIGEMKDGKWQRRRPDPSLIDLPGYQSSPHLRGSVLVAAVFDAFLKIYRLRSERYIRLATGGSGILPDGNIPADLAEALTNEASRVAKQFLNICIRALDYLPPIDITFGEYLRAAITADKELVPDDPWGYRVAFVECFRAWGIQPEGVTTVTPESLCWSPPDGIFRQFGLSEELLDMLNRLLPAWRVNRSRRDWHQGTVQAKIRFNLELRDEKNRELGKAVGIDLTKPFEVHTLRPTTTVGPDGDINPMVVVTLLQKKEQAGKPLIRTGSTLLFSRGDGKLRYVIHKRDSRGLRADERAAFQKLRDESEAETDPYLTRLHRGEPFAALHLSGNPGPAGGSNG